MLWKFYLRKKGCPVVAEIVYDWDTHLFSATIPETTPADYIHLPVLWAEIVRQRGECIIGDADCRAYLLKRIYPPNRHGISWTLSQMGVKYYHECFMLRYMPRSTWDDFITEFVEGENIGLINK